MATFTRALAVLLVAVYSQGALAALTRTPVADTVNWFNCPVSQEELTVFALKDYNLISFHADDMHSSNWGITTIASIDTSLGTSPDALAYMSSTKNAIFSVLQANGKGKLYAINILTKTTVFVGTIRAHPWGAAMRNNEYWYILDSGEIRMAVISSGMAIESDVANITVPSVELLSRRKAFLRDGDMSFGPKGNSLYISGSVFRPSGAMLARRISVYNTRLGTYKILREGPINSTAPASARFGASTAFGAAMIMTSEGTLFTQSDLGGWFHVNDATFVPDSTAVIADRSLLSTSDAALLWCPPVVPTTTTTTTTSDPNDANGRYQTAVVKNGQIYVSFDYGNTWAARESIQNWWNVCMSSSGLYQTAVVSTGQIFTSADTGSTWTARDINRNWRSVSMSADGAYQTAVVIGGNIYTSSNFGNSWTARDTSRNFNWLCVSVSSTGQYQTAVAAGERIYISSDFGQNWVAKESNRQWFGVSVSSSGQYQTAVDFKPGLIYISSDYGSTWTAKESSRFWRSVALSSTGQYQTAVVSGATGQIFVSSDYGATWTAKESSRNWVRISVSTTGQYQTAVASSAQIYVSSDYGSTWTAKESNRGWQAVAVARA